MLELSRRVLARLQPTAREGAPGYYPVPRSTAGRHDEGRIEETALLPAYRRERC
ncbi:MAG: hypothetical protein ACFBWO_11890 [Paracoccaceae bacterium]